MGSNRSPTLKINKGKYRRFNLFHCRIDGCCNFISSLGLHNRIYCKTHQVSQKHLSYRCKGKGLNKVDYQVLVSKRVVKRY